MIMIHGLATNLAFWIPLTTFLQTGQPFLLFDLRGHGRSSITPGGYSATSMVRDVKNLMDGLDISAAHLLGHSYGGAVAVEFAGQWPDRCISLMLADARIRMFQPIQRPRDWPNWTHLQERLASIGVCVRDDQEEAGYFILTELARLSTTLTTMTDWPRRISEVMGGGLSRQTATRWLELVNSTSINTDVLLPETVRPDILRTLSMPVFSAYGELSPVLKSAESVAALWPHGAHHRVTDVGHFFPLTQARLLSSLIHSFLGVGES